uniref:Uncharacterized protein n=1 Tax=Knipowitschia caucasica TaxID=637954 RepID=A0AAV2J0W6_KNICA
MADRTQTLHPTIVSDGHGTAVLKQRNTLMCVTRFKHGAAELKQRNTLMHGGRFAHFTKEGKQMVNGCLSPIFRLKRKRQPTQETNRPWTMTNQCKAKSTEIVQQTQLKAGSSSIREHLEAILTGDLISTWESRRERPTLYFEDEQLDEVAVIRETPRARQQNDWIDVVMNVLVP